ncbi:hypothetical protein HK097_008489 [Rhizophlyctis rosea]|uniref:Uncharacterized protein n=1 Tax=Rhizophlyctis rosea TaxID=64517 RepID=A0AAD5SL72_9FUNG|nr:hypothetical protein HK097_008489 [Rhizophlyctis rosea]
MDIIALLKELISLGYDPQTAHSIALIAKDLHYADIAESEAQRAHELHLAELKLLETKAQADVPTLPRKKSSTPHSPTSYQHSSLASLETLFQTSMSSSSTSSMTASPVSSPAMSRVKKGSTLPRLRWSFSGAKEKEGKEANVSSPTLIRHLL